MNTKIRRWILSVILVLSSFGSGVLISIDANTITGDNIAENALVQQGKSYTRGGSSPNTFDCSGLVYWTHNQAGYEMKRTTTAEYDKIGQRI